MVNPSVSMLLKSFNNARLSDKVLIATALHYSRYNNKQVVEKMKQAWVKAIKIEIDLQYIADLYRKGLADYTEFLNEYTSVAEFIVTVLGEALK